MEVAREATDEDREAAERARRAKAEAERKRLAKEAERRQAEAERDARELDGLGPLADALRASNPPFVTPKFLLRTVAADEARHPERYEVRVSRAGNVVLHNKMTGAETIASRALRY